MTAPVWLAHLEGMPPREVPYSRISAFIQSTPRSQWRRLANGSFSVGAWVFWRAK